ncbi:GNAT family N-acetyltransferase [Demetria terragena]|uniref:GNAT family N-acetyltransferase n=1 Tax=Demetria terragena TaxID=63959 RepID=UPI00037CB554|nr:GNAT family N-acetyltransferase [Demetria terragena]
MTQPVLRTERLTLQPLRADHLEHLVELDSDPEVLRYLYGRALSRAEVEARMPSRLDPERAADGRGFWCGFVGEEFVGWWLLVEPDRPEKGDPGDGVLGYRLRRKWWRQGLASEGSRELLRYAFVGLDLPRVTAETMAVNEGSRAVMRSIGMTYWHTFHEDFEDPLPGIEHGEVVYAISRDEWNQSGGV